MIRLLSFIIIGFILTACSHEDILLEEAIRRKAEAGGNKLISYKILKEKISNKSAFYFYTVKVESWSGEVLETEESLLFERLNNGRWKLYR